MPQTNPPLDKATIGLATMFFGSGAIHLARPQVYEAIVPHALPRKREIVYASGVAEIICGLGLLHPRTRKVAGLASAVLLVAVLPANVQMRRPRQACPAQGRHRLQGVLRGHRGAAASAVAPDPHCPARRRPPLSRSRLSRGPQYSPLE